MRHFMDRHCIQLKVAKAKLVPLARTNDGYLIDDFRLLSNLTADDVYNINRVRIFLQVTTLSDISDGSGMYITDDAFAARPLSDRRPKLRWPRQPSITTLQRTNLWKTAIESAYTSWGRRLHQPLGHWNGPPNNQIWSTTYHPASNTVTVTNHQANTTQQYFVTQESRWFLTADLHSSPAETSPISKAWHTTIPLTCERMLPSKLRVSLHRPPSPLASSTSYPSPSTFRDYLATLPTITQRLLTQFEFVPGGEQCLRECLATNRRLRAASDGSLDPIAELSSFGWQLLGNGNVLVRGAGPVDGVPDLLSSTRTELFGISAVLEFIHHFCSFSNLASSTSKVLLWVDNKAAIHKVYRTRKVGAKRRRLSHDADIICQITDRLNRLPLKIRLQWVKSHQDHSTPYSALDIGWPNECRCGLSSQSLLPSNG
jgi:hypothetical protein